MEVFARRLQFQEQLTGQIADALMEHMQPKGAIVMIEAEHMCMTMRGNQKTGKSDGDAGTERCFETDPSLEERFSVCWDDKGGRMKQIRTKGPGWNGSEWIVSMQF